MILPSEQRLPQELLDKFIQETDEDLKIGIVSFIVPINYLLVDAIREHYCLLWNVFAKEYKNSIKLSFSAKPEERKITIVRNDKV